MKRPPCARPRCIEARRAIGRSEHRARDTDGGLAARLEARNEPRRDAATHLLEVVAKVYQCELRLRGLRGEENRGAPQLRVCRAGGVEPKEILAHLVEDERLREEVYVCERHDGDTRSEKRMEVSRMRYKQTK